jgi:hypothetical protein
MTGDIETWRRRGEAARLAHETVNRAFREHVRERDPDRYDALLKDFWEKTAAALPSTDRDFMPGLAKGYVRFVETGIAFLEADPWFFRSGYEKQNIIRHVKRAQLTEAQRLRLARVVLAAIDGHASGVQGHAVGVREKGHRVEFRHFGRLACGIWSDFLDEEVANRMQSPDPGIRRRATWVAEAAISAGKA